jgi:hypothetical protein
MPRNCMSMPGLRLYFVRHDEDIAGRFEPFIESLSEQPQPRP